MSDCTMAPPAQASLCDQCLLERVSAGDQPDFEALMQRYQKGLSRLVCRYLGNLQAQDVLQEICLQWYVSLPLPLAQSTEGG